MKKLLKVILVFIAAVVVLSSVFYLAYRPPQKVEWGINFSPDFASFLGFKPRELYAQILNELQPKYVRLTAYWEDLEASRGLYDLGSTDMSFMLDESAKRGVKVILVLGHKQPRWPECHHPSWYEALEEKQKEVALLNMLQTSVNYFKNFEAVEMWQIENEPYFEYGPECGEIPSTLFKKEIEMVKSLDDRPVVVTDSGEKGFWLPVAYSGGDIFGSTMYRKVFHDRKNGYVTYPLPAFVYRVKAGMVRMLSPVNKVFGVELQAEPWFNGTALSVPWEQQERLMNPEIFYGNINYAKASGMDRHYFWGVEWWYWAKGQGHDEMWEAAKEFFDEN